MKLRNQIPNLITSLRMIGTAALIFAEPFSEAFFALYLLTGVTDALDGWLARRFHLASELGARLDSVADLLFYAVTILRIFPELLERLPAGLWAGACAVLALRLAAYLVVAVRHRRFASMHTWMNKLTGAAVFLIPCLLRAPVGVAYCTLACAVAALASLEELLIHVLRSEYREDVRSLLTVLFRAPQRP